nr:unnamed protein product [Callosobruchus analis]
MYEGATIIYTDGSKSDDKVGSAFITSEQSHYWKLDRASSIFTAELYAIWQALRAIRLVDAPNLTKDLHTLELRRRIASLTLFYRFYHGRCSSELSQIITPKAVRTRNTREALHAHPYQVEVSTPRTSLLQYSLFWQASTLWNELPGSLFPEGYNLQRFKTNVHRHLSSRSVSTAP